MVLRSHILFALLLPLSAEAQTGPGGVGSSANNVLWLDANRGITLSASNVTNWADQSGNSFNAVPNGASARPSFVSSSVNGYPSISFDGNNDELWVADNAALDLTQWHFFIVPRVNTQKNYNAWLTKGNDGQENFEMLSFSDGNIHSPTYYTDATRTFPSTAAGQVTTSEFNIIEYSYAASVGRDLYKNGTSIHTDNENKTPSTNNFSLYIGNERTQSRFIDAALSEVIMYNGLLNSAQRIITNNYLSAKYDIALSANDIYTMDNIGSGNYDHEVAGIGRVDASNIQSDSQGSGVVRILNASGMGDGEFYLWGHDNGALGTYQTGDYPAGEGVQGRWVRVWRGSEVGTITSFDLRFNLAGLGSVTASQLRLLIDTDNDGTFADETSAGGGVVSGASLVSGAVYQFTGVTGLNNNIRFTLGSTNLVSTPLPIELVDFKATYERNQVFLNWTTASEKNNDHFDVERSANGIDFELLGQVSGLANSTSRQDYFFKDEEPLRGISYYRLKQVDTDGSFDYSPTQAVVATTKENGFVLSPNPSDGTVNADLSRFHGQQVSITIKGLAGRIYESRDLMVPEEHPLVDLNELKTLQSGTYLVTIRTDTGVYSQKLLIQ